MDTVQRLIAAAVLALAGTSAHAGYAQAKPPPGFQPMPQAAPVTNWGYAKVANDTIAGTTVRTTTSLNVGGRTVTMPAAMRFASNAPRFAAAAIFASPHIRTAIGIATLLTAAKIIWDDSKKQWLATSESDGFTYRVDGSPTVYSTAAEACNSFIGSTWKFASPINQNTTVGGYYYGSYSNCMLKKIANPTHQDQIYTPTLTATKSTQQQAIPITESEFIQRIINPANNPGWPMVPADWPLPATVPQELPSGTPLPVELPVINPAPGPLPETRPAPRPYFDPSGDPVPNPNYNPQAEPSPTNQPYIQPGTKIQPSPTPSEPWRVDVQPVNRPSDTDAPKTAEELNPQPDPNTNPNQQPKDQPKPEEQQQLCEKFPDILACQKLDTPEAKDLAREEVQISISPLGGWGAEDAACPAPKTAMVMGREVSLSWQPVCDFATGLRPLVIALAWLSAATMLIVVARRGN